jgi:hypothetical protein
VLDAQHPQKLHAHLVTEPLARLHVQNLARRSSLKAESTRKEKGGEKRSNVAKSGWKLYKASSKFRWRACVYPERGNEVVLPTQPLELWAPYKAHWVWAGADAKYLFW